MKAPLKLLFLVALAVNAPSPLLAQGGPKLGTCTISFEKLVKPAKRSKLKQLWNLATGTSPFSGTNPPPKISWAELFEIGRRNGWSPAQMIEAVHAKYGDQAFFFLPSGEPVLFLSDPAQIDAILKFTSRGPDFGAIERDPLQSAGAGRKFGPDNVFTGSREGWKHQREVLLRHFKPSVVETPETYGKMTQVMARRTADLRKRVGAGKIVDMQTEMENTVLDITLSSLLHTDIDPREIDEDLRPGLTEAMKWMVADTALNPTPWDFTKFPTVLPAQGRAKKAWTTLFNLVERVIEEHEKKPRDDLVTGLLSDPDIKREDAKRIIATIIAASFETSASYGTWSLGALAHDAKYKDRVNKELSAQVGARPVQPDSSTPALDAVLSETLRYYSPFFFLMRRAKQDFTMTQSDGSTLNVPAGTHIVLSAIASQRDDKAWGVDSTGFPANEYRPERWLPENPKAPKQNQLCVFGGGQHLCMGMKFANSEIRLIVSQTLQNFEVTPVRGQIPDLGSSVATHPVGGMKLYLKPREVK